MHERSALRKLKERSAREGTKKRKNEAIGQKRQGSVRKKEHGHLIVEGTQKRGIGAPKRPGDKRSQGGKGRDGSQTSRETKGGTVVKAGV